ncbi:MAG: methyltransferase domain-containing protein [Desulfobacterales bacterium]|nr:methyltransferase domain-containing protein [Desulfobacterales bacterium]
MIHQKVKDVYYLLLYPVSFFLRFLYMMHYKIFRSEFTKIHVGCGRNYLSGFVNIDANFQRKADYLLDARVKLPFPDDTIDFIYSCHMLEHVHITEAINMLKDWYRVLKPSGYARLTLPDFEYAIQIASKKHEAKFPRAFDSPNGQAINFLFCDGQHKFAYAADVIEELASKIGFSKVEAAKEVDPHIESTLMEPAGSFSVNLYK